MDEKTDDPTRGYPGVIKLLTILPRKEVQFEERRNFMEKYVCQVCGYVYDPAEGDPDNGVAAGTAFADVPADWVCPVCGADKDSFSPE